MNPQYWYFWIGLMLIGVVLFLPSGILGGVAAARRILQPQSLNPRSGTAIR
jgi:branched-chain amino acid transport system permease protein